MKKNIDLNYFINIYLQKVVITLFKYKLYKSAKQKRLIELFT